MLYEIQPTGPASRLSTQQVGYDQKGKLAVNGANCSNIHNIISSMAPHEFNVILRTTTDEFNILPRTFHLYIRFNLNLLQQHSLDIENCYLNTNSYIGNPKQNYLPVLTSLTCHYIDFLEHICDIADI